MGTICVEDETYVGYITQELSRSTQSCIIFPISNVCDYFFSTLLTSRLNNLPYSFFLKKKLIIA